MSRPTVAHINGAHLKKNFQVIIERLRTLHGARKKLTICAMVKADAYGHGVEHVCPILASKGVRLWGVHSVQEGVELRELKIPGDILVLGGIYEDEIEAILKHQLLPVLHHPDNLRALLKVATHKKIAAALTKKKIRIHLKLDTGMGRFGFRPEMLPEFIRLYRQQNVFQLSGTFAHLPRAEDSAYVTQQRELFMACLNTLKSKGLNPGLRHHSNSLASLLYPEMYFDLVRPGLVLYGVDPYEGQKIKLALQPVMSFATNIVSLRDIPKSEGLSYGHSFVTSRPSRIATVPVGYADGYPRGCSNRAAVLVRGQRAPIVGRVCMDMSLIDVTEVPGVKMGDEVILFGRQGKAELSVWEIAKINQTIPYEILCGVSPRVPRLLVAK